MKRVFKWIAIIVGSLIGLLLIAALGLAVYAQMSFKRSYADRALYPITADISPEGQARGEYLMEGVMNCTEACHSGENTDGPLAGFVENINEGPIAVTFAPPNLTPDIETGLGGWSDGEIARAIREGIDKDGVGLVIMPSHNYYVLSDADVAAMVGYLRGLEPVRNQIPPIEANIVAKMMLALGIFGPSSIGEPITEPHLTPEPGTVEYGAYLVKLGACSDCHGEDLAGGPMPMAAPDDPVPANLTPGGDLASWTEGEFIAAVYGGIGKGGIQLSEGMPNYRMDEADLRAIFAYLQTIPAVYAK